MEFTVSLEAPQIPNRHPAQRMPINMAPSSLLIRRTISQGDINIEMGLQITHTPCGLP